LNEKGSSEAFILTLEEYLEKNFLRGKYHIKYDDRKGKSSPRGKVSSKSNF